MRSKQRKTSKFSQQYPKQPLTPNPYLSGQKSTSKIQNQMAKNSLQKSVQLFTKSKVSNVKIDLLIKENKQLKKQIIQLKVNQFYQVDDIKLKQLIIEVENLRKEVKKCRKTIEEMMLENDFLKRMNKQLKFQLGKDIQIKKKDSFSQDITKCTLKYSNHPITIDDEITHLSSTSGNNFLQNTTIEQALDSYGQSETPKDHNKNSRKNLLSKCLSSKRQSLSPSQQVNQYLLYRRNKQRQTTLQRKQ